MASGKKLIDLALNIMKKSSSIGKLMMEKSVMERSRRQKFQSLGELTYSLFKANRIQDKSLKELIIDIDEINSKLREASHELDSHVDKDDSTK